jgi:hypothetical protein
MRKIKNTPSAERLRGAEFNPAILNEEGPDHSGPSSFQ